MLEEPDDISQYDFRVVRIKKDSSPRTPPGQRAPAPKRRPRAAAGRAPRAITPAMQTYIDSLPRGERAKARNVMTAYRNFGNMNPDDAIARYRQRKSDDARTPLDSAGEFEDELGTDDESDSEPTGGALGPGLVNLLESAEFQTGHPALAERLRARAGAAGLTRGQEIAQRRAQLVATGMSGEAAATQEVAERDQIAQMANDSSNLAQARIQHVVLPQAMAEGRIMQQRDADDAPDEPGGGALYTEPLTQPFGGEGDGSSESTVPIVNALFPESARNAERDLPIHRNAPLMHDTLRVAQTQIQREQQQREAQRRAREEWEATLAASRAVQRDGSESEYSGSTVPFG